MRNVEPAMTFPVALHTVRLVLIYIVAIKITSVGYFCIAAHLETRLCLSLFLFLRLSRSWDSTQGSPKQDST